MARGDKKLEHLQNVGLFSTCSKKELDLLGRASEEVLVPAGKVLCEEGTTGHEFFLILDGEASVRSGGEEVAKLGPGQYFGEISLLDHGPRNATVVASTDSELLVLGQREFSGVLDSVPGLAHKMLRVMAARVREADANAHSH